ncbi:MAG: tRNA (adenosine(37)-N6)-threonylcarbamoyltransferase complex transferase subunit TsaD [Phycisphaerae bacterium]|nr:tRNA (adenosine(37)-N6)-threonylcarbamoyltransferase complex transferase subunit TsaD [Phycisphaerae bacterium]
MKVLGIESSCDETSAAVVEIAGDGLHVRSCVTASQDALHEEYRGVVPEIASRAHLECIVPVVRAALRAADATLESIDGIASGTRPGLIGSLLVGTSAAKAIAWASARPFVGVDHVAAHLVACLLDRPPVAWPALGLVVSGGHTSLFSMHSPLEPVLLGATIDDAAGEAFDKAAAILGVGYPGGARLDAAAERGDPALIPLPRTRLRGHDFSFSGLKTALALAHQRSPNETDALAASFRFAVVDQLLDRTWKASEEIAARTLLIGGGVAANALLRRELTRGCEMRGIDLRLSEPRYCTDNAAMIAATGALRLQRGERDGWETVAEPLSSLARGRRGERRRTG